jgi:hypothetical protein
LGAHHNSQKEFSKKMSIKFFYGMKVIFDTEDIITIPGTRKNGKESKPGIQIQRKFVEKRKSNFY